MDPERLRKLGEAIGGKPCGQIPEGSNPAGLAAYYQFRRIASLPLFEQPIQEVDEVATHPDIPPIPPTQANIEPASSPGQVDPSFTGQPAR